MISTAVIQALEKYVPGANISLQEPLAEHTTFRIGGPADCFVRLENTEQLIRIKRYLDKIEIPMFVIGNGSNLLVDDRGYRGVILQIAGQMNEITVEGNVIRAQAGATMAQIAHAACNAGLTGFEFAAGIPGTIGGGVVMNAGAYDGEMKQVVTSVTVVNRDCEIMQLDNETMEFGYRTSAIKSGHFVVTEVELTLQPGEPHEIAEKMNTLATLRREKQPLEYPSAGSTFKRPQGYYAGKLIMDAGLKGYRVGGAQVSEKHCGFVINTGNATGEDVRKLIHHVQNTVHDRFGVTLETEVIYLGGESIDK